MAIQRWDPLRELRQMDDTINRLWRGFGSVPAIAGVEDWNISLDVIQKDDAIVVKASVPGVQPKDIDVAIEDNILTLRAERKEEFTDEKATYLIQERHSGSFYRALSLPDSVDTSKVNSVYENGVLTITLPKAEEKKKKQIKVNVNSGVKAIEANSKK